MRSYVSGLGGPYVNQKWSYNKWLSINGWNILWWFWTVLHQKYCLHLKFNMPSFQYITAIPKCTYHHIVSLQFQCQVLNLGLAVQVSTRICFCSPGLNWSLFLYSWDPLPYVLSVCISQTVLDYSPMLSFISHSKESFTYGNFRYVSSHLCISVD